MSISTRLLAKAVWQSGDLFRNDTYDLHQLFQIRDALYILDRFNLADIELLKQVELFIDQKAENA